MFGLRSIICLCAMLLPVSANATNGDIIDKQAFRCQSVDANPQTGKRDVMVLLLGKAIINNVPKQMIAEKFIVPRADLLDQITHSHMFNEQFIYTDGIEASVCDQGCTSPVAHVLGLTTSSGKMQVIVQDQTVFFTENQGSHDGRYNVLHMDTGRFTFADPNLGDMQCAPVELPK